FLVDRKLLRPTASPVLDALYSQAGTLQQMQAPKSSGPSPSPSPNSSSISREVLLLTQSQVAGCSEKLDVPALEVELERAIWQVEQAIEKEAKEREEEGQKAKEAGKERDS
ncbi:hypothetical protein E4U54_000402, partial [Claviceps lovelessii]